MIMEQTQPVFSGLNDLERAAAIREAFDRDRQQIVLLLARQLGVPELDVVRAMPEELVEELDFPQWEDIVRSFEALGDVHVIVSNGASTLEVVGAFGKFSNAQGFFNVQTKSLDMHIRSQALAAVFAVRKPRHTDGKDPSVERLAQYAGIIDRFR